MISVELIYDDNCPFVPGAREHLKSALAQCGQEETWREWERGDPKSPDYADGYGSPTILIDGRDVGGESAGGGGKCCRMYSDRNGKISGIPSVEAIVSALSRVKSAGRALEKARPGGKRRWWGNMGVLPVIGTVFLPGISCPACWPAYAALLSSFGLGFVNYTRYLLPLTVLGLFLALASLWMPVRRGAGVGPLVLGSAAAVAIIAGRFVFYWQPATFAGVALLVAASIWNLKSQKSLGVACPKCVPAPNAAKTTGTQEFPKGDHHER